MRVRALVAAGLASRRSHTPRGALAYLCVVLQVAAAAPAASAYDPPPLARVSPTVRSNDVARALAVQPDGNIIVAGTSDGGARKGFALARYTPAGRLDPSFGQDGKSLTQFGSTDAEVAALLLQPDGKMIVVGYTHAVFDPARALNLVLVRYTREGTLDRSFAMGGMVFTALPTVPFGTVSDAAFQTDGKLVVAVRSFARSGDFALLRYLPAGDLDPGFGAAGTVTASAGFPLAVVSLALQPDGKILVAGTPQPLTGAMVMASGTADPCPGPRDGRFFLARYQNDGRTDTSFAGEGLQVVTISAFRAVTAFAFQPEGKIVIGGDADCHFALARYDLEGNPDRTFGTDGVVTSNVGRSALSPLTVQPDGKIVGMGYAYDDLLAVRYNADGSVDSSFGANGTVTIPLGDKAAVSHQPDGTLVIAGYLYQEADPDFAVLRYHPDGTLDTTFGAGGIVTTHYRDIANGDQCETAIPRLPEVVRGYTGPPPLVLRDGAAAVLVQPDGRIVVAGTADYALALVRYNPDGALDRSFGTGGTVTVRIGAHPKAPDLASALALQPDGKIVVSGAANLGWGGSYRVFLVRYNPDGSLDPHFGAGGKIAPLLGSTSSVLAVLPDGHIVVVVGPTESWPTNWFLVRLRPDGSLDARFGAGGESMIDLQDIHSALVQPDGQLLIAGVRVVRQTRSRVDHEYILQRYRRDGTVDVSFGAQGKVALDRQAEKVSPLLFALQPDGKIVGAGWVPSVNESQAELRFVRYNPDGRRDRTVAAERHVAALPRHSWSEGKKSVWPLVAVSPCLGLCHLAVQEDGNILVLGNLGYTSLLLRYSPTGTVDEGFGTGGMVLASAGSDGDVMRRVAFQRDGKIVLAGTCANARHTNFAVLRYLPDGSLDPTFGGDGRVTTRVGAGIAAW